MTALIDQRDELRLDATEQDHTASSGSNATRNALRSSSRTNKWKRRGLNISSPDENMAAEWAGEGDELPTQHWSAAIAAAASATEPKTFLRSPRVRVHNSDEILPYGKKGLSEAWELKGKGDLSSMALNGDDSGGEEESGNENDDMGRSPTNSTRLNQSADSAKNVGTSQARYQRKKEKREHYNLLMELLHKDDYLLTEAICASVLGSLEDEADIILPELVRYMLSTQMATEIIVRLIRAEVFRAVDEGTILRGNEPISVMLTAHAKIVGRSFLRRMLKPEIALLCDEINQHKLQLEIDPIKLKAKGDENAIIQQNTKNLICVATRFLERIKSCSAEFPSQIRYIAAEMRRCLLLRFPSSTVDSVLGGYIFLRLICPIIVSPATAGLSNDEDDGFYLKDGIVQKDTIRITQEAQRGLVLLSKLLQQLANGTEFGWKEEFMVPLNSFLKDSRPIIKEIFDAISTPAPAKLNDDSVMLEKGEVHLIKFIMHKLTHIGINDIENFVLNKRESSSMQPNSDNSSTSSTCPALTSSEDERTKLVLELKKTLRVLGKPPRSLRKYYDIVFYDKKETSTSSPRSIKDKGGDKLSVSKKFKEMKKKMKKVTKRDNEERISESPSRRVGTAIRRRATTGKHDAEMWRSDSCGKVDLSRTTSKKELRLEEAVRRVRSSEKPEDLNSDGNDATSIMTTDSEEHVGEESSSDDDSETGSDFDFDSDEEWQVNMRPMPLSARPFFDYSIDAAEKSRKKAEMAKKLLEEKYKSQSMRNLRAEREAMKIERQNDKRLKEKELNAAKKETPPTSNSGSKIKKGARSITLTDVQVVKREQENEVLRRTGGLSPRGRNFTSPPSQKQAIEHHSDSDSSESSSEEEVDPIVPERANPKTKGGVLSRIPILRIPVKDDFKFLSPRRASGRKDD